MVAHLPDERVDAILDHHGLPERTPDIITDREELDAELERVRSAANIIELDLTYA